MRALSAAPLGVPGKALRLRRPGGYQARLRRPGNAVPSKITHPLNIIDFTLLARRVPRERRLGARKPSRTVGHRRAAHRCAAAKGGVPPMAERPAGVCDRPLPPSFCPAHVALVSASIRPTSAQSSARPARSPANERWRPRGWPSVRRPLRRAAPFHATAEGRWAARLSKGGETCRAHVPDTPGASQPRRVCTGAAVAACGRRRRVTAARTPNNGGSVGDRQCGRRCGRPP